MNTLSGIILEDKNPENYPVLPNQISRTFLKRVSRSVSRTVSNTEMIQKGFQERVHVRYFPSEHPGPPWPYCPWMTENDRVLNFWKTTRTFWNDSNNVKYRKLLCQPERKLVITSKEHAAWPSNSVSQPMLFLFSDLLASWTQMSLTQWPIKLMWIKSYSGLYSKYIPNMVAIIFMTVTKYACNVDNKKGLIWMQYQF